MAAGVSHSAKGFFGSMGFVGSTGRAGRVPAGRGVYSFTGMRVRSAGRACSRGFAAVCWRARDWDACLLWLPPLRRFGSRSSASSTSACSFSPPKMMYRQNSTPQQDMNTSATLKMAFSRESPRNSNLNMSTT